MDDRSADALVREVLAGHREAFADLVLMYQDYAYGTAIAVVSDFELARDVVQEAFLCAFSNLHRMKDPARFGGWLHGIVRNKARRALRELSQVRALADQMGNRQPLTDPAPGPCDWAMENERRQIVRQALGSLRPANREVLCLHYVDGLSYADVASYLGVSESTVLGRLQRGRAELKKELLNMVEDAFKKEHLPPDFSAEINRLLERASAAAKERESAVTRLAEIGTAAVDPLCQALGDPRPIVRRVAARALCRIGDARALGPFLRVLYAGDHWLDSVFRTGQVLRIPGVREELLRLAGEGSWQERYWAFEALKHAKGDAEVYERLLALFQNEVQDTGTRCGALGALCELRGDLVGQLVDEALRDPHIRRRSGYAWWIAFRSGYNPPLELCLGGLKGDVAPNGRHMAGLLARRHGKAGIDLLENLMRTGSPAEQEAAAVALANTAHGEAFDVLVTALSRGGQERKWGRIISRHLALNYAARLLEWTESSRPDLSASPELAWAIAQARLATGEATAADLLGQGPPTLRADALRKLVEQSGAAALPQLRRCLAEETPKKLAREAFWQMHKLGPAAEPVALDMLSSAHWSERKSAVCLLRRWGKLTPQQKAQALADPHVAVRHSAQWNPEWLAAAKTHPKWGRKLGS